MCCDYDRWDIGFLYKAIEHFGGDDPRVKDVVDGMNMVKKMIRVNISGSAKAKGKRVYKQLVLPLMKDYRRSLREIN